MDDLSTLTDDELDARRVAVLNEQERRARRASAPAVIADLVARYEADGGDRADLTAALEHAGEEQAP